MTDSQAQRVDALARRAVREAVGERRPFTITKFGRHEEGFLHARVSVDGDTTYVHRKFGSWLAPGHTSKGKPVMKEVRFEVARELQVKAHALERAERTVDATDNV